MVDKRQYADRPSGDLLPRHASAYIPPHRIPAQPDARTMENRTVQVAPELDPRLALTQVSMARVREQRRGYLGIAVAALFGTLLAVGFYAGVQSAGGAVRMPAFMGSESTRASQPAKGGMLGGDDAVQQRPTVASASGGPLGSVPLGHVPVGSARRGDTGIVEEVTEPEVTVASKDPTRAGASRSAASNNADATQKNATAAASVRRNQKKSSNSRPPVSENSADEQFDEWQEKSVEGPKVWLE